ncbi:unnamed protein product [Taenia asiatica]|uniref:Secreted protein n=1 Tax=Taenia asiatica TaxID=60517 RepID=A0A0R3VYQ6_TAEAS|nr:unnamed protein product [Taenia asiatica]
MIFSLYLSDSTAFSVIIPFLYVLTSDLLVHRLHQACRGTLLDSGTLVSTDSSCGPGDSGTLGSLRRIPIEADLLVAYAVQPGKFSASVWFSIHIDLPKRSP